MKYASLLITLLLQPLIATAQVDEMPPPENIRTIIFNSGGNQSQLPIIRMGEPIRLSFDDLNADEEDYYYYPDSNDSSHHHHNNSSTVHNHSSHDPKHCVTCTCPEEEYAAYHNHGMHLHQFENHLGYSLNLCIAYTCIYIHMYYIQ